MRDSCRADENATEGSRARSRGACIAFRLAGQPPKARFDCDPSSARSLIGLPPFPAPLQARGAVPAPPSDRQQRVCFDRALDVCPGMFVRSSATNSLLTIAFVFGAALLFNQSCSVQLRFRLLRPAGGRELWLAYPLQSICVDR